MRHNQLLNKNDMCFVHILYNTNTYIRARRVNNTGLPAQNHLKKGTLEPFLIENETLKD